jgi:mitochondrial fission protein ELM1
MTDKPTCWILTDGKAGMESQCLGLAEALDLTPVIKRITSRFPWSILPPQLWVAPLQAPSPPGDDLAPPWPDLLIATGRQTVAPALAIKKAQGSAIIAVQIQNPTVDPSRFDLVIAPKHDDIEGSNVVTTLGALHRITPERLTEEAARCAARYAALPRPLVAVLIGGTNKQYRMTEQCTDRLADLLVDAAGRQGLGLAVTASRRTGVKNIERLKQRLSQVPSDFWDETGDNPYFGMLGLADAIVVTGDSVNMVTEACATGKPVHVFQLEGGSGKFRRFHQTLQDRGLTRPFVGSIDQWETTPLDDMARAVDAVRDLLSRHDLPILS